MTTEVEMILLRELSKEIPSNKMLNVIISNKLVLSDMVLDNITDEKEYIYELIISAIDNIKETVYLEKIKKELYLINPNMYDAFIKKSNPGRYTLEIESPEIIKNQNKYEIQFINELRKAKDIEAKIDLLVLNNKIISNIEKINNNVEILYEEILSMIKLTDIYIEINLIKRYLLLLNNNVLKLTILKNIELYEEVNKYNVENNKKEVFYKLFILLSIADKKDKNVDKVIQELNNNKNIFLLLKFIINNKKVINTLEIKELQSLLIYRLIYKLITSIKNKKEFLILYNLFYQFNYTLFKTIREDLKNYYKYNEFDTTARIVLNTEIRDEIQKCIMVKEGEKFLLDIIEKIKKTETAPEKINIIIENKNRIATIVEPFSMYERKLNENIFDIFLKIKDMDDFSRTYNFFKTVNMEIYEDLKDRLDNIYIKKLHNPTKIDR